MSLLIFVICVATVLVIIILAIRAYILRASVPKHLLENTELLHGKVVIITGATSGIGLATAKALYKMGAYIILGARDHKRSQKAIQAIRAYRLKSTNKDGPEVECIPLDLADLDSVQHFVQEFKKKNLPCHYLINNAGAVFLKSRISKDGFELTWQTNHLSHFLLTTSLLDILNKSKARIINLSSNAHTFCKKYKPLTYEEVHSDMRFSYASSHIGAYAVSKLCNILFTRELQKRVDDDVIVVAVNPGFVKTELSRETPGFLTWLVKLFEALFAKTPMQGAYTTLYVVLMDNIMKGGYYEDCQLANSSVSKFGNNEEYAKQLWELSKQCLKS